MHKTEKQIGIRKRKTNVLVKNGKVSFREKDEHSIDLAGYATAEDRRRIRAVAPTSEEAQAEIVAAIARYRMELAADTRSLATKRLVLQMQARIRKLLAEAKQLQGDPIFFRVGLHPWSPRTGPCVDDIALRTRDILELDQILADGLNRMAGPRGRKPHKSLESLIKALVWVHADTNQGKHIKRTIKGGFLRPTHPFVVSCVKIADPAVSHSSIENILTRIISEHHKTLDDYGFNTATGEYVAKGKYDAT